MRPNWSGLGLAALYLLTTNLPLGLAAAAPQLFSRPGAGVSRLPLQVTAFDAPGFGELADAINLANGSVYVDLGSVARNETLQPGDEQQGLFGNNWSLKERQRLSGFRPDLLLTQLPDAFSVMNGDGSARHFARVTIPVNATNPDEPYSDKPSWIKRYKTLNASSKVVFYRSQPQHGTENPEAWLVLLRPDSTYAHLYQHDGTRATFSRDGEYVDYTQDPHQQLRGAKAGDPEGNTTNSPKTEFSYHNTSLGQLEGATDEWKRSTDYAWNANNTLHTIRYQPNGLSAEARKVTFGYNSLNELTSVTYATSNGFAGTVTRKYDFSYTNFSAAHGTVRVLSSIKRAIPTSPGGASSTHETTYAYQSGPNGTVRIESVTPPLGREPTRYTFGQATKASVTPNGLSAQYFNDTELAIPADSKFEALTNGFHLDWREGSPSPSVESNNFSARLTGRIIAPLSGAYTFTANADDQQRVWVNGKLIIDRWDTPFDNRCCQDDKGTITLEGNRAYNIVVEYREFGGGAHFTLKWQLPGSTTSQLVPANALVPTTTYGAALAQTNVVIVQQGAKKTTYAYDEFGRLRQKTISDINPTLTTSGTKEYEKPSKDLSWGYQYYNNGFLALIEEHPSRKTTHFAYDARGNTIRRTVYTSNQLGSQAPRQAINISLTNGEPEKSNTYDFGDKVILHADLEHDHSNGGKGSGVSWRTTLEQTDSNPFNGTGGGSGWGGWWAPQPITTGFKDDEGRTAYQMAANADYGPDANSSGMIAYRPENKSLEAGRYLVSFNARTVPTATATTLDVLYGLDNAVGEWTTLTPKWRRIEQEFNVPSTINTRRIFQAGEITKSNLAWQISDIHVTYLGNQSERDTNSLNKPAMWFNAPSPTPSYTEGAIDYYKVWAVSKADPTRSSPPVTIQVQSPVAAIRIYAAVPQAPARINVAPGTSSSARTMQFGAELVGRHGRKISNTQVVWSIDATPPGLSSHLAQINASSGTFIAPAWEDVPHASNPDHEQPTYTWRIKACHAVSVTCKTADIQVGYTRLAWRQAHLNETWSSDSRLGYRVAYINPTKEIADNPHLNWSADDTRVSFPENNGCIQFPPQSRWYPRYGTHIRARSRAHPNLVTHDTYTYWDYWSNSYGGCAGAFVPGHDAIGSAYSRSKLELDVVRNDVATRLGLGVNPVIVTEFDQNGNKTTNAYFWSPYSSSSSCSECVSQLNYGSSPTEVSPGGKSTANATIGFVNVRTVDAALATDEPLSTDSDASKPYSQIEYFHYDNDNRLAMHAKPRWPTSLSPDNNIKYQNYQEWREIHSYVPHAVTSGGQTFEAVETDTTSIQLGGSGGHIGADGVFKSNTAGTEQRSTKDTYNTSGLLETSVLTWENGSKTRSTTYTYADGTAKSLPGVDASGSALSTTNSVKQWGDQARSIMTSTSDGLSKTRDLLYDAFGNVAQETLKEGVATESGTTDLIISSAYNGFQQKVWEQARLGTGAVAREQVWNYAPSGELMSTWSGAKDPITNQYSLTDYAYNTHGLVNQTRSGSGSGTGANAVVTTAHKTVTFEYDAFGRVYSETEKGDPKADGTVVDFSTITEYDTLDRPVSITLPDNSKTTFAYDEYGSLARQSGPKLTQVWERDIKLLGNVARETLTRAGESTPFLSTSYQYDQYGRVLRSTPNNGSIVANSADFSRDTTFTYDDEGRLKVVVGPVLRTSAIGQTAKTYFDNRRPATRYTYDTLGRRLTEAVALSGKVNPDTGITDGRTLVTTTTYDGFDRPESVNDNNGANGAPGYAKSMTYDRAGNLTSFTQEISKSGEVGYDATTASAVTKTYYDAAGRVIKTIDAAQKTTLTTFDRLGNVRTSTDENGKITKAYTYTPGGLLLGTYEPTFDKGGATTFSDKDGTFTLTSLHVYGNRPYPTATYRASGDSIPVSGTAGITGGVKTSYTYDYAGRPETISTEGRTVTQVYNEQGKATSVTDADGFTTTYEYDHAGRVTLQAQELRAGNSVDSKAFPNGATNLRSSYQYDTLGNLTRKTERGLLTEYAYNSLGKVIAETRPRDNTEGPKWKYRTYDLTGNTTAETGYGYDGDLLDNRLNNPGASTDTPSVTTGSVQVFELDGHGNILKEAVFGAYTTGKREDRFAAYTYNGLDKRVKRSFRGHGGVHATNVSDGLYKQQRTTDGSLIQDGNGYRETKHDTHWRYDVRGLLTKQYDTLWNGGGERNVFTYTYTATGKPLVVGRDVSSRVRALAETTEAQPGVLLAASLGSTITTYNERDLPKTVTVTDESAAGIQERAPNVTRTTAYHYYANGAKKRAEVFEGNATAVGTSTPSASTSFAYDAFGRETLVKDSNGTTLPSVPIPAGSTEAPKPYAGSADTRTEYLANGVVKTTTTWGNGLTVIRTNTPTLDGLPYRTQEWQNGVATADPANPGITIKSMSMSDATTTYRADGLSATTISVRESNTETTDSRSKKTYDTYKQGVDTTYTYNPDRTEERRTAVTKTSRSTSAPSYTSSTETEIFPPSCNTKCQAGYTETKTSSYENGVLKKETYAYTSLQGEAAANGVRNGSFTTTYLLDAQGRRYSVSDSRGGAKAPAHEPPNYDGYWKRYDADDRVALFYKLSPQATDAAGSLTPKAGYNEFFYDPFGQQVMSSAGATLQTGPELRLLILRDVNTTFTSDPLTVMTRKRQGKTGVTYHSGSILGHADGYYTADNPYSANDGFRDEGYSIADGIFDGTTWAGVELFNVAGPTASRALPFEAPVEPVSFTVRLDPVSILPPSSTPVTAPTPEDVKQPQKEGDQQDTAQLTLGVTTLNLQPLPSLNTKDSKATVGSTSTTASSAGFSVALPLEAPSSVIPGSVSSVGVTTVSAPFDASQGVLPNLPGVGQINAPGQPSAPSIGATPADGIPSITPPGESSAATPNIPGVTQAGRGVEAIQPPASWKDLPGSEVDTLGWWEDFISWLDAQAKAASLTEKQMRELEQQQKSLGDAESEALTNRVLKQLDTLAASKGISACSRDALGTIVNAIRKMDASPQEKLDHAIDLARNIFGYSVNAGARRELEEKLADLRLNALQSLALNGRAHTGNTYDPHAGFALKIGGLRYSGPGEDVKTAASLLKINGQAGKVLIAALLTVARLQGYHGGNDHMGPGMGNVGFYKPGTPSTRPRAVSSADICKNSFSADTPVMTSLGLLPIGTLVVGQDVLAYDETTGQNGYYPINEVFENVDPQITFLTLVSEGQQAEAITTTPEHPFYVKERSDGEARSKPVGHEDLNEYWVGAGHLKVGDKIKKADGTFGVVKYVNTVTETRTMYNLDVAVADTFFVGTQGWLVHNQNGPACGVAQLQRLKAEYAAADISDAAPFLLKKGGLSQKGIKSSTRIMEGSELGNPAVIQTLTKDGSSIADWGKYSLRTKNGEIHYYYNPVTRRADYSIDFKIKYGDGRVVPLPGK